MSVSQIVEAVLRESYDRETRTYAITASPEHLDKLEELFAWMNLTRGGHSGTASIFVDGDGAARIEVAREDGKLPKFKDIEQQRAPDSSGSTEFTIGLD